MIIYKATNITNNKVYIGQTTRTLEKRIKDHTRQSKKKYYFQRAIQKYGINNFVWDIIEQVETQDLLNEREKYWINHYNSTNEDKGYNITIGGEFGKMTGESEILRVENAVKARIENGSFRKIININTKQIFDSSYEASRSANVTPTAILSCCNNLIRKAGQYTYAFLEEYKKNEEYYNNYIWEHASNVKVINLTTGSIFNNLKDAGDSCGIGYQNISKCCRKESKFAAGYFWAYYDKYCNDISYKKYCDDSITFYQPQDKQVINITTGKIYNSLAEAGREYNIDSSAILRVCKGKRKTSKGCKWMYYEEFSECYLPLLIV